MVLDKVMSRFFLLAHVSIFLILLLIALYGCNGKQRTGHPKDIHIIYSFDPSKLTQALISMESIVKYSKSPLHLHFHLILVDFVDDMDTLTQKVVKCLSKTNVNVLLWDPPIIIRTMQVRLKSRPELAAAPNYVRFYVKDLIPGIQKFLYIDNDVIARRPIEELWNIDLKDNVLGLVHECGKRFVTHVVKKRTYNLSHPLVLNVFGDSSNYDKHCFPNAGVMFVNQTKFDELHLREKVEFLIKRNREEFIYLLGSQPLVVLSVWNHYLPLSEEWNARSGRETKNPGLIHFNGGPEKKFMQQVLKQLSSREKTKKNKAEKDDIDDRQKFWKLIAQDLAGRCPSFF